ncbi:transporter [Aestuariicella hydrocarbonica]|uniref:Transporter n=1 Tax=Pseudomaricurvus hydrocarbonicus TaxID=1470433 RepID=A0A9E5JWH1_9GAMM|nr:transporter [Aestuariicella hydrocarbonica]NHO66559.1 transporter [Aestuariicella hydrocarbonica]
MQRVSARQILTLSFLASLFTPAMTLADAVNTTVGTQDENREKKVNEVVSSIIDNRGVLTSKGTFIFEPSFTYTHSSATVVAIEGFTVLPALIIGLINISQAERDIFNYAITLRYGLTSRMEVSLKVPYIDIDESIRERQALDGTPVDIVSDTSGDGLGDVEMSVNYQLNDGLNGWPFFIANLRVKSDTGTSIFDLDRRQLVNDDGDVLGVIFDEQPTGSGFWAYQPGLTVLYPTDPAVIYGSISYLWNEKDDKGAEFGGEIKPGDIFGFSFGIGFSVNERTSFSLGYEHNVIDKTEVEFAPDLEDASFDRYHSGSLLLGISQQTRGRNLLNLSLAVGVTEQSPDVQLTFKMPFQF